MLGAPREVGTRSSGQPRRMNAVMSRRRTRAAGLLAVLEQLSGWLQYYREQLFQDAGLCPGLPAHPRPNLVSLWPTRRVSASLWLAASFLDSVYTPRDPSFIIPQVRSLLMSPPACLLCSPSHLALHQCLILLLQHQL